MRFSWDARLVAALCVLAVGAGRASAQDQTAIVGTVTDTTGRPLPDAVIVAFSARRDSVQVRTDTAGAYRLVLPASFAGAPISVSARHLGHRVAAVDDLALVVGGDRKVSFRLVPVPVDLERVVVSGRKGAAMARNSLRAGEFNPRYAYSALDAIKRFRPRMLGDKSKCDVPGRKLIERLYINGVRRDRPLQDPLAELEWIRSKDVEFIYYADCMDTSVPIDGQRAVYVVLKPRPLTKKEQKALDELKRKPDTIATRDSAAPPPQP